ncbi:MAG TPA: PilZ domain-containing protein [Methylomirabilota bacterium]|nr:PilZ domain-containing protein [Methylomirabilota bacterium]
MSNEELEARRPERRKAPRFPYQAPVEIEWGSARLRARTRDISASGMFLELDDVLWVGAGFRARLAVERPVYMECSVKRVEPGRGMGVTVALQDEQSGHFQDLLARLADRT